MATLKLDIVTPEGLIFEGEADSVLLPGVDGDMQILPQHMALVTELKAGELQYVKQGKTDVLAIGEGFAEITGSHVSVLTDGAVNAEEIDEAKAEQAVKRAEELLKSSTLAGEELEATQAVLARSLAQLHVKRRRKS